jgi:hypothetical protein
MSVDAVGRTPEQLALAIQQDLPIYRGAEETVRLRTQAIVQALAR